MCTGIGFAVGYKFVFSMDRNKPGPQDLTTETPGLYKP